MERGRKWLVDFSAGKTQLIFFFFDRLNNCAAINLKMNRPNLDEK